MFSSKACQFIANTTRLKCFTDRINYVQVATVMNLKKPPSTDHIEYPERRKLKVQDRSPFSQGGNLKPTKMTKRLIDMRGPETVHNKLQYGDYGLQAVTGGKIRWGHYEMMRMSVLRGITESRMFAVWRVEKPWKPITKKGQGQRMGGGKGAIDHYVFPVKSGRMIVEIGGVTDMHEVKHFMEQVAKNLPFKARVVSQKTLDKEAEKEKFIEENNINPFNFHKAIRRNYLGCSTWVSPYDFKWDGKYR